MPDRPTWCGHLDEIAAALRALPHPWVDRAAIERILRVGRRRAQQILQPCVKQQIGANGVADREELISHLHRLASGESIYYERRRRENFARALTGLRDSWQREPKILVEAPAAVAQQEIANLPDGVTLRPGEIVVRFSTPTEALQKLLALAMAAGNDLDGFERKTRVSS